MQPLRLNTEAKKYSPIFAIYMYKLLDFTGSEVVNMTS